ncbi:MAG: hypothetical protein SFU98_14040 [Leptospiraceae bacterium]|nr:hypothetical protein [Leptospiraceae bacterium]
MSEKKERKLIEPIFLSPILSIASPILVYLIWKVSMDTDFCDLYIFLFGFKGFFLPFQIGLMFSFFGCGLSFILLFDKQTKFKRSIFVLEFCFSIICFLITIYLLSNYLSY